MNNIIIIVVIVLVFSFIMAMIITGNDKHISEEDREKMVDDPSVLLDEESNNINANDDANDNINADVLNEDLSDNSLVLNEFKPDKININNDLEKHDNILDDSNIVNSDVNFIKNDVEDSVDINDKFLDIDDEVI